MNIEDFRNLVEIQSVEDRIAISFNKIKSEETRMLQLKKQNEEKTQELSQLKSKTEELKKEMSQIEKSLFEADKRVKRLQENMMQAKTDQQLNSLKTEEALLLSQIETLESNGLIIIEAQEATQTLLTNCINFLAGFAKTIIEIQSESQNLINGFKQEIENDQERINNLLSISDRSAQSYYHTLEKKYKHKKRITFIENQSCSICRYQIPKTVQSSIEKAATIELCPGCERILIPHSVVLT